MKLGGSSRATWTLLVGLTLFPLGNAANAAKIYNFVPIVGESSSLQLVYSQGKPVGLSVLQHSAVAIWCDVLRGELWINISAENGSNGPIDIDPLTVKVVAYPDKKPEKTLDVLDPVKYVTRLRRTQAWAIALGGLSNALNSQNAGNSYSTTNFSGVAGGTNFSGFATTETYDYSKDMAVRQAQQHQLMQQAATYRQSSDAMDAALLKRNTLPPHWMITGAVLCKYYKAGRFKVSLPLGGELHEFDFKLERK